MKFDAPWLSCDTMTGRVETSGICRSIICFRCDKTMLIDHGRIVSTTVTLKKGKNDIFLYAGEPGVIVEKLVLHPANIALPDSLLGPAASCTVYH